MKHETAVIVQTGVAAHVYEVQRSASCPYQTERAGAYSLPSILVGLCNLHVIIHNDQHGIFLPLLDGACSRTFCIGFQAHRNMYLNWYLSFLGSHTPSLHSNARVARDCAYGQQPSSKSTANQA